MKNESTYLMLGIGVLLFLVITPKYYVVNLSDSSGKLESAMLTKSPISHSVLSIFVGKCRVLYDSTTGGRLYVTDELNMLSGYIDFDTLQRQVSIIGTCRVSGYETVK